MEPAPQWLANLGRRDFVLIGNPPRAYGPTRIVDRLGISLIASDGADCGRIASGTQPALFINAESNSATPILGAVAIGAGGNVVAMHGARPCSVTEWRGLLGP